MQTAQPLTRAIIKPHNVKDAIIIQNYSKNQKYIFKLKNLMHLTRMVNTKGVHH